MEEEVQYNKDITRLIRLHEEYGKQRTRILALMKVDCKLLGISTVAKNLKKDQGYISRILNSGQVNNSYISHDALVEMYIEIQAMKNIMHIEGKEDK